MRSQPPFRRPTGLWRTALLIVAVPFALVAAYMALSGWWWRHAETTVANAVTLVAHGARAPGITVSGATAHGEMWNPRRDFGTTYRIEGADSHLAGASIGAFLDPTASAYVAHLHFANGHTYHVEAVKPWREGWQVAFSPAEDQ